MPCNSHCISPGYTVTISLILVLPLGAVLPEVAWSPTLKANDGIGICPLGSWVVVVICSCRPAPTVLGQVAKLLAVSACWYTRTVMLQIGIKSQDTIMSDSEHSTVTYTSVPEDDSDIGSPGVEGPIFQDPLSSNYVPGPERPPSPDYVPGLEEPEQAPPSPIYIPFVPEPVYPEFLPIDDE
ncbi:hypothetical protein Tco_1208052, partial [Tanacetum coccineum]